MATDTVRYVTATINGNTYNLSHTTGDTYSAVLTAPAASSFNLTGGYYPVSVTAEYETGATTTVDDQTAGAIGQAARLVVKEKVKPTIVIVSPTQGQYVTTSLSSISAQLRDNANGQSSGFSGIKLNTLSINIRSVTAGINISLTSADVSATSVTGGYDITYTVPQNQTLPDASDYVITVNVSDNDGNAADAATVNFVIDTTPPQLSVTAPTEGLSTFSNILTVSGSTSDSTSSPVTVAIYVDNVFAKNVTVAQDGSFSTTITLTTPGNVTIEVRATDAAGKTSTVTRHIFFSDATPTIKAVRLVPNPVDGGTTFTIEVDVE